MIKKVRKFYFVGLLLLFCTSLFSCGYTKEDAEKYLPGQYFYRIPSGEFQELTIHPDFTFKQVVYSKNMEDVLFENTGMMYVDGRKIKFRNWLECYELADQKMLTKPYNAYSIGNYWRKLKKNEDVLIIIFDETNYVFRKKNPTNF